MRSIFFCIILIALARVEAKFSRGDSFQFVNIEGSLTIKCVNQIKIVTCRDVFMDPWPYDIFIGPKNTDAERVELRATAGGKPQIIMIPYEGAEGRSADINLGVYSLFQKPLLKVGENKVEYVLFKKSNDVLETGTFNVSVTRGKSRLCAPKETSSNNPEDCDLTYSFCQLYFRSANYCR